MSQTVPESSSNNPTGTTVEASASALWLETIYGPIKEHLVEVENVLVRELKSDAPFVEELLEHSRKLGGKRMRPVFLLLSGGACGSLTEKHQYMAAALELIHTATLIHDDVLDHAETRRHLPTANSKWGSKVSVLLGDYLFTHSFHVASFADSVEALRILANASNRVCAGEMRQNAWVGNFELSEAEYLLMIADKTAELCSCGCRIGALLSGADENLANGFEEYGRNLGVAFQIIDDVLDIVGQTNKVGKTLGTDIINQKPTLPLIHCLANLPSEKRQELLDLLHSDERSVFKVMPYLEATDSLGYASSVATAHANRALEFVKALPESPYSKALASVADFVLERRH